MEVGSAFWQEFNPAGNLFDAAVDVIAFASRPGNSSSA
jgi:hypothetical protein